MISRPMAMFLGLFSLLNILGDILRPGFDANLWWIDFAPLPRTPSNIVLAAGAVAMLAYAIRPAMRPWRSTVSIILTAGLLAVSLLNVAEFYVLLSRGLRAGMCVPMSAFIAAALAVILAAMKQRTLQRGSVANKHIAGCHGCVVAHRESVNTAAKDAAVAPGKNRVGKWIVASLVMFACVAGFPVAQMVCYGKTDYRRPADAIVVFGAGVYADNHPSEALTDRVRTGVQLYQQGLAGKLIFSGGPGAGTMHETEVMRDLATNWGVPSQDIILDRDGLNTHATVNNTVAMFGPIGVRRVLVVSHFYHLPRIRMCYQRHGIEVYTVPAQCEYVLRGLPYFMAREVGALWAYYLQPLGGE